MKNSYCCRTMHKYGLEHIIYTKLASHMYAAQNFTDNSARSHPSNAATHAAHSPHSSHTAHSSHTLPAAVVSPAHSHNAVVHPPRMPAARHMNARLDCSSSSVGRVKALADIGAAVIVGTLLLCALCAFSAQAKPRPANRLSAMRRS